MVGIVSYGTYIPINRIKIADIASLWKKQDDAVSGIGVIEKSVAGVDEDAITLAVSASFTALKHSKISAEELEAILIGSESHPYAVKPSSTIVGEILGTHGNYFAADLEFACKAGTAAVNLIHGLVRADKISYGLAVGSDTAQAKPGDILECTAGSAAAAFILGKKHVIADILDFVSYSSDTPDFWRRDGQKYPSHGARFTGEPAYFTHVTNATTRLLEKTSLTPKDFRYAVFHMPNGKFPKVISKKLGFTDMQLRPGFLVENIGNPYTASSLMGLAATLDIAKPKDKIFVCSYGSGAGSDAFAIEVTPEMTAYQKRQKERVAQQLLRKKYIDYLELFKRQLLKNA